MAVSHDPMGGDLSLTTGVIRMSDTCVVLEVAGGGSALLVWSRHQTGWDPIEREVLFEMADGRVTELRDGRQVSLGGSGQALSVEGRSVEEASVEVRSWDEWVSTIDWAAEPDSTCPVDSYWSVGEVLLDR